MFSQILLFYLVSRRETSPQLYRNDLTSLAIPQLQERQTQKKSENSQALVKSQVATIGISFVRLR